jgi:hypothetical protein
MRLEIGQPRQEARSPSEITTPSSASSSTARLLACPGDSEAVTPAIASGPPNRRNSSGAATRSPHLSTVCTHHVDAGAADASLRCRPWGKHRFMIRCGASESTLMFQPVRLIHNGPVTTANTACFPTRRLRRRCSGHRVQEMASPRTTTAMPGRTLRVCWQPTGNTRARCGNHKHPFPQKPTRDKHPGTPPAVPRGPQPTATQQSRTQRHPCRRTPRN